MKRKFTRPSPSLTGLNRICLPLSLFSLRLFCKLPEGAAKQARKKKRALIKPKKKELGYLRATTCPRIMMLVKLFFSLSNFFGPP